MTKDPHAKFRREWAARLAAFESRPPLYPSTLHAHDDAICGPETVRSFVDGSGHRYKTPTIMRRCQPTPIRFEP